MREQLELPLTLGDGSHVITRNISPSGLLFETKRHYSLNATLDFELILPDAPLKFTSSGVVVRVELSAGGIAVAVRLTETRIEALEEAAFCEKHCQLFCAQPGSLECELSSGKRGRPVVPATSQILIGAARPCEPSRSLRKWRRFWIGP